MATQVYYDEKERFWLWICHSHMTGRGEFRTEEEAKNARDRHVRLLIHDADQEGS